MAKGTTRATARTRTGFMSVTRRSNRKRGRK